MLPPPSAKTCRHDFIQLLSFSGSSGSYSHPERTHEYVREVGEEHARVVYTYPFLVMCRRCTEIRKVEYRDG